jgi:sortase B
MKKTILVLITFTLILTVAGCGFWLTHYFIDAKEQRTAFENLSQKYMLESTSTPEPTASSGSSSSHENSSESDEVVSLTTAPLRHDLAALAAENPDCVGWITIPDTGIDYPVMHTPDDPERYLRRDFSGSSASHGTPFLDGRNQDTVENQNLILYGHNMMDGSMFKPLISYLEPSFRETHQEIYLELSEKQYQYNVLAVVETSTTSPVYTFTSLADPTTASDFRATLLKETDLNVVHQADGYLTLSTCNNGGGDSRVLVIAALAGEVSG